MCEKDWCRLDEPTFREAVNTFLSHRNLGNGQLLIFCYDGPTISIRFPPKRLIHQKIDTYKNAQRVRRERLMREQIDKPSPAST